MTMEHIMEHISTYLNEDSIFIRERNAKGDILVNKILPLIKKSSEFEVRSKQITKFNQVI